MIQHLFLRRPSKSRKGIRRSAARQCNQGWGRTLRLEQLEDRRVLALVGVAPLELPTFNFGTIGSGSVFTSSTTYDSATGTFFVEAKPMDPVIEEYEGETFLGDNANIFEITIELDSSGNLVGGELVFSGTLLLRDQHPLGYEGELLTAEAVAFGYEDSGGSTDQFDFLFTVTGGNFTGNTIGEFIDPMDEDFALYPINTLLGLTLTVDNSTFTGDFSVDFGGGATGQVGIPATPVGGNASVSGFVWEDFNNDGFVNFGENVIEGVTVQLLDENGVVIDTTTTDQDGLYAFDQLDAGTYGVMEVQPAGFVDGLEIVGEIDGSPVGDNSVNDKITGIVLDNDAIAVNYNFGERPEAGGNVSPNQTASIAFWQNRRGQELIASVNEGLGDWLAATLPNLYGDDGDGDVNPFDLTGMTNQQVAEFYKTEFRRRVNIFEGPPKLNSQVLASAIAVYVTNSNLAGLAGLDYGFSVTDTGVGTATVNVGYFGVAFGVENHTDITVLDALFAANSFSQEGWLYDDLDMDLVGNGQTSLQEWLPTSCSRRSIWASDSNREM
jgi:hypothetical protein